MKLSWTSVLALAIGTGAAAVEPEITIRETGEPPATANSVLSPASMANVLGRTQYVLTAIDAPIPAPPDGAMGSGTCDIFFDLDTAGNTSNIRVDCPDELYARRITDAARTWTFEPVRVKGTTRPAKNVFMTVSYDIVSEVF